MEKFKEGVPDFSTLCNIGNTSRYNKFYSLKTRKDRYILVKSKMGIVEKNNITTLN